MLYRSLEESSKVITFTQAAFFVLENSHLTPFSSERIKIWERNSIQSLRYRIEVPNFRTNKKIENLVVLYFAV